MQTSAHIRHVSKLLKLLFLSDQRDRFSQINDSALVENDSFRLCLVKMISVGHNSKCFSSADDYRMGMIFHHKREPCYRGLFHARNAMLKGHEKGSWLYLATIDRRSMRRDACQKFGTQYSIDDDVLRIKPMINRSQIRNTVAKKLHAQTLL
jgi:hypothetical protein